MFACKEDCTGLTQFQDPEYIAHFTSIGPWLTHPLQVSSLQKIALPSARYKNPTEFILSILHPYPLNSDYLCPQGWMFDPFAVAPSMQYIGSRSSWYVIKRGLDPDPDSL